jgi:hypothetical protein
VDPALGRLVEAVRAAHADGRALEIRGAGTKRFLGQEPRGEVLDVSALAGIVSYEPSELVVTAKAGTPLAELETLVGQQGQFLPFEPPRFAGGGTVGGMVAAGLSGPGRLGACALRDYVLGTTLLDGRGELLHFGGQVIKNVAGYDVSRVMAGAMGVLGVLCEVSIRLLPRPVAGMTLEFDCDLPGSLRMLQAWRCQPLPLSASSWHEGRLRVRLGGARAAVASASSALQGRVLLPEEAAAWWASLRDQRHPLFALPADAMASGMRLWLLSLPMDAPHLQLPGEPPEELLVEVGGSRRWLRTSAPVQAVRAATERLGGTATLFRGARAGIEAYSPVAEPLRSIHRRLKAAFDPAGILNPGRLHADF